MKVTGTELRSFMDEAWPTPEDHWYWDHDLFDVPDSTKMYDTDEIGPIMYQGVGDDPTRGEGYDLAKLIRKFRKTKQYVFVSAEIPKERYEEFLKFITSIGAKTQ